MNDRPESDAHASKTLSGSPKREPPVLRKDQNENVAEKHLGDVPFLLYSARVAARQFWALACRKYPELKDWV